MAHWDSQAQKIVDWPTIPIEVSVGWVSVDCGCCAGLRWGTEYPTECPHCKGSGMVALHVNSRRVAEYPGGPLLGMWRKSDVERALA